MLLHVCRAESEGPGQIILEKFFPASMSLPITIRYCGFFARRRTGEAKDANKGTVPERVQSWLCRIGKQNRTNLYSLIAMATQGHIWCLTSRTRQWKCFVSLQNKEEMKNKRPAKTGCCRVGTQSGGTMALNLTTRLSSALRLSTSDCRRI